MIVMTHTVINESIGITQTQLLVNRLLCTFLTLAFWPCITLNGAFSSEGLHKTVYPGVVGPGLHLLTSALSYTLFRSTWNHKSPVVCVLRLEFKPREL